MAATMNTACEIIVTAQLAAYLQALLARYDSVFLLTDTGSEAHCLSLLLEQVPQLANVPHLTLQSGEAHKSIDEIEQIWHFLQTHGATRNALLVNLGGGMVTDMGGFAAATFKRGMHFVNLPTTLLGAIDAATGGKTGFNFGGLKNEIGLFANPDAVLIDTHFFATLSMTDRYAGLAEMLKHALITDAALLHDTLVANIDTIDSDAFRMLIERNLAIKKHFAEIDPHDTGLRHALNFGHTFGHALEALSHAQGHPTSHGTAVMWGMICALYLSHVREGLPQHICTEIFSFAKEHYPRLVFSCDDYDRLLDLMRHDKKNSGTDIKLVLLKNVGQPHVNQTATSCEIFEAFDFLREH